MFLLQFLSIMLFWLFKRSNNGYSMNSSHSSSESKGRSRGKGSGHGVLGPPPSTRSRPTCQVCHNIGHSALDCYHHYDHAYQSSSTNQIASLVYVGNGQVNTTSPILLFTWVMTLMSSLEVTVRINPTWNTTKKIAISDGQSSSQQHKKPSQISSVDGKRPSTSVGSTTRKTLESNKYGIALTIMVLSSLACGVSLCTTRGCVLVSLGLFRLTLGLGIGADYPLSATIMSEFANKRTRGAFIAAVFSMQGFGILAASLTTMVVCKISDFKQLWQHVLQFPATGSLFISLTR
uniref:Major facilitator superfamily (MFS) profile domain-containing protein n=1 Tax=Quercus lobata TaxID=97700 RepID=A0A7N2KTD8_QUELO